MEIKSVILSDKREILLDDDNDITISIVCGDQIQYTLEISYPIRFLGIASHLWFCNA